MLSNLIRTEMRRLSVLSFILCCSVQQVAFDVADLTGFQNILNNNPQFNLPFGIDKGYRYGPFNRHMWRTQSQEDLAVTRTSLVVIRSSLHCTS